MKIMYQEEKKKAEDTTRIQRKGEDCLLA